MPCGVPRNVLSLFRGISAILSNTPVVGGMSGLLGVALAHGLALSIAVNVFGGESGAHFNPAVIWVAPIAGACVAALIYEHVLLKPMKPSVNEPRAMRA